MSICRSQHSLTTHHCDAFPFSGGIINTHTRTHTLSVSRWKFHLPTSYAQSLIRQDSADQLGVVNLARASIDCLQELIHLLLGHLLAQVGQDVLELTNANKASHVLVEDLETAAVFVRLAWIAEAAGTVEYALKCLEVDCKIWG